MNIQAKSVDMDMDMDGKFHIHGNPDNNPWHSYRLAARHLSRLLSRSNINIVISRH